MRAAVLPPQPAAVQTNHTPEAASPLHGNGPRHDWQIGLLLAQRLEKQLRPGLPTLFPYTTPEAVWNEHRESTRGRDLDITGLSYAMIDDHGPQQWPLPDNRPAISRQAEAPDRPFKGGEVRLYADGSFPTADGKARFAAVPHRPVAEARESKFPFSLTTGSGRDIKLYDVNKVGLERRGFPPDHIHALHQCFRLLRDKKLNTSQALERIRAEVAATAEREELLEFIRSSERGFVK